jgi:hypothetical protein
LFSEPPSHFAAPVHVPLLVQFASVLQNAPGLPPFTQTRLQVPPGQLFVIKHALALFEPPAHLLVDTG